MNLDSVITFPPGTFNRANVRRLVEAERIDLSNDEEVWRTIHGSHIEIDEGTGTIEKGPAALKNFDSPGRGGAWLAPSGKVYPVHEAYGHEDAAKSIMGKQRAKGRSGFANTDKLIRSGYVKVGSDRSFHLPTEITAEQHAWLSDAAVGMKREGRTINAHSSRMNKSFPANQAHEFLDALDTHLAKPGKSSANMSLCPAPPELTCIAADIDLSHDYGPVDYWREIDGHPVPFTGTGEGKGKLALPSNEQPGAYRIHTDKGSHTVAVLRARNGSGYEVRHTKPNGDADRSFHGSKSAADRAMSEKAAAVHGSAVARGIHQSTIAEEPSKGQTIGAIPEGAVLEGAIPKPPPMRNAGEAAAPAPSAHELTRYEFREQHPGEDLHDVDVRHRQLLNDAIHRGELVPKRVMESHPGHKAEITAPRPLPAVTHGERESAPPMPRAEAPPPMRPIGETLRGQREKAVAAAQVEVDKADAEARQAFREGAGEHSARELRKAKDDLDRARGRLKDLDTDPTGGTVHKLGDPVATYQDAHRRGGKAGADLLPNVDKAVAAPNAVTHPPEAPKPAQAERFVDKDTGNVQAHPPGPRPKPPLYRLKGSAIESDRARGVRDQKMRDLDELEEHYSTAPDEYGRLPDAAKRQRVYETVHAVRQDLADRENASDWQGAAENESMHRRVAAKNAELHPERVKAAKAAGKTSGSAPAANVARQRPAIEGSAPAEGESTQNFFDRLNAGLKGGRGDEDTPSPGVPAGDADYGPKAHIAIPHVGDNTPWVARIKGVNPRFAVGSDPGLAREFIGPHHVDESGANETGSLGISSHYHLGEGVYEAHYPTSFKGKEGHRQYFKVENGERKMMFPAQAHEYARSIGKVNLSRMPEPPRLTSMADDIDLSNGPHKFASTQINLPPDVAARVKAMAAKIPDEHLAEDGREDDPHVTVKYGLHADGPDEALQALAGEGPARMTLGKTSLFPASGDHQYDVVKLDVDSPDLHRMNAKLAKLPHTDTHPTYRPHVTVAYVKPGMGKKYAGMDDLHGLKVTGSHVQFSAKDRTRTAIPLSGDAKACPSCGSSDIAPDRGSPRTAYFHCNSCTHHWSKPIDRGLLAKMRERRGDDLSRELPAPPRLTCMADDILLGSPDQPRVPAGSPEGGEYAGRGGSPEDAKYEVHHEGRMVGRMRKMDTQKGKRFVVSWYGVNGDKNQHHVTFDKAHAAMYRDKPRGSAVHRVEAPKPVEVPERFARDYADEAKERTRMAGVAKSHGDEEGYQRHTAIAEAANAKVREMTGTGSKPITPPPPAMESAGEKPKPTPIEPHRITVGDKLTVKTTNGGETTGVYHGESEIGHVLQGEHGGKFEIARNRVSSMALHPAEVTTEHVATAKAVADAAAAKESDLRRKGQEQEASGISRASIRTQTEAHQAHQVALDAARHHAILSERLAKAVKPVDTSRQIGMFSQGQEIGERPGQVDLPGLSIPRREPAPKAPKVKAPKADPDQLGFGFSRHHHCPAPPRLTCMADDVELSGDDEVWRTINGTHVEIDKGTGEGEKGPMALTHETVNASQVKPVHGLKSKDKLNAIVAGMKEKGWEGRPILAIKEKGKKLHGLTGTHRVLAARKVGIGVPVHILKGEELEEAGIDPEFIRATDDEDKEYKLRRAGFTQAADLMKEENDRNEAADRSGTVYRSSNLPS